MIKLQNIHYQINNKVIFRNLQLNFVDKKINCILGPSGSGKTTLLNIIAKIIKPQMGKLLGVPKNLSYVFQEERLIPELTVYQNLKLVLSRQYHNQPQILDTQINKYLELVALIDTKNLYPHELSGSMRQRLALVRAFAYRAEVLIMDEPFGGIDIMMKQSLITDLIKLWSVDKRTIIFVTHDLDEALLLSNVIYVMSNPPMSLIGKIKVDFSQSTRQINDPHLMKIKNQLFQVIKNWSKTYTNRNNRFM